MFIQALYTPSFADCIISHGVSHAWNILDTRFTLWSCIPGFRQSEIFRALIRTVSCFAHVEVYNVTSGSVWSAHAWVDHISCLSARQFGGIINGGKNKAGYKKGSGPPTGDRVTGFFPSQMKNRSSQRGTDEKIRGENWRKRRIRPTLVGLFYSC